MTEAETRTISPEIISQAVTSLDRYIVDHYSRPARRTLRGRQITVVEDLRDTLRGGQTEGYVTIPTGVGKTVLFTEVTEALNKQGILETMIVVPTKILVDQTEERFHQFAPGLDVGKLYTFAHDITRPVTVTTYASLVKHIQGGTLDPQLYKLLVLDEVHRSLSGKRSQAVAQFTNAIKLGFTATPMYSEDRNVANLLNTEIHKMTIREAVEEDLLSPFSVIIAETETDLSNISIKSNGDYDDEELEKVINIVKRNQSAVDLYNKLFRGQTAVAYCASVKHAQDLAKLFTENGVAADFVSGYQDKKTQAETLRRYHGGGIKVLCNADLLIEGFDEPRVSVCLNLRPTKSMVVAQQRAGRVLRLDPANPNKHAVIVDFLDKIDDPRKLSVTFAEVAEAAQILTKKTREGTHLTSTLNDNLNSELNGTLNEDLEDFLDFEQDAISISGLRVIVNSLEVMRIVKEIQNKAILDVSETDLKLTIENLREVFMGRGRQIANLAGSCVQEILTSHPELIATRKNSNAYITVCTNRELFMDMMLKRGISLRAEKAPILSEEDLVINYKRLGDIFIGGDQRLAVAAQEVTDEIRQEYPDLIAKRFSGAHIVTVSTDRQMFIDRMLSKGFVLREQVPTYDPEEWSNGVLTVVDNLRSLFLGKNGDFLQALGEIQKSYPEMFVTRRNGPNNVVVCKDKDFFLTQMQHLGVNLRISELGPNDFAITWGNLSDIFISYNAKGIADDVVEMIRKENPDLIIQNPHGIVCRDRNLFISYMLEKGARLRDSILEIQEGDLPISYGRLWKIFRGIKSL